MKTFCTQIMAINPKTGELCKWDGPRIEALSFEDAEAYCTHNLGYCKVIGILVEEIENSHEDEITDFKPLMQQHSVSGSVLKINLKDYGYPCGDGCCYNYGTITTVNDIELPCHNQDAGTILSQVLEHLGYKVEIDYSDD